MTKLQGLPVSTEGGLSCNLNRVKTGPTKKQVSAKVNSDLNN